MSKHAERHLCDCGRPAARRCSGGWCCERCRSLERFVNEMLVKQIWLQKGEDEFEERLALRQEHERRYVARDRERRQLRRAAA